jgi:hypothetical protein
MSLIRRIEPVDLLRVDDTTLMLYETRLVQLSALAAAIYDLVSEGMTMDALTRHLEEEFGTPPDSTPLEATSAAVEDLVGQGIVAWEREPAEEP